MQGEEMRECLTCGKQFAFIGVPICRDCAKAIGKKDRNNKLALIAKQKKKTQK